MQTMLTVEAKTIGQKKSLFDGVKIPLDLAERVTMQDLITRIVIDQVQAFRQRQDERRLIRFLSADQIAQGAARGKIEMGGSEIQTQVVDDQAAVANALQAFRDGIYLAFVDGQQIQSLETELQLRSETRVSFMRLVMLAGG